ncbi:urea transporter [Pseudoalteromonas tunicata]|jgi:urea transporter|uniref:Putative urea transporter n=1 Tax=Pseudoalteromonas tunicata D2 TaxID=87626 RepID=A4C741_9GAMM|nr:urea transporter [Pseudoalteromonas tunicata]ATC95765.1 urea transporter [Pseudoalteromonas tunicata]AXT31315.1 urea transporter [Pseudoalteromonas tunicata]EAR29795.1 putative urea transporter [Pseudoalteromonas tunicata D2]
MSPIKQLIPFIKLVFRGLGQVMLQNNAVSGGLFLLAVWMSVPWQALAMLLGALLGSLQAKFCDYDQCAYQQGVFGFNGALVALGASFFYPDAMWVIWPAVIGFVFLATVIMAQCIKRQYSGLTSPFVVASWILLLSLAHFGIQPVSGVANIGWDWVLPSVLQGTLQAFSQVFFQGNNLAGVLIILGLAINQFKATIITVLVAAAIALVMPLFGLSEPAMAGLLGFNAVLCSLVFANRKTLWPLLGAVLISLCFMLVALSLGITALTAPFVLATWLVLSVEKWRIYKL